jgi:fluoride exporter
MMNYVLVGAGGALGAMARYLAGQTFLRLFGPTQPYLSTFLVNVVGGLGMGLLIGFLALKVDSAERWRLLLGVGVLGGFTTFSAFALEAVGMFERKAYGVMAAYVAGSVVLSIVSLMLGLMVSRRIFS